MRHLTDFQYRVLLRLNQHENTRPYGPGAMSSLIAMSLQIDEQKSSSVLKRLHGRHLVENRGNGWHSSWRISYRGIDELKKQTELNKN